MESQFDFSHENSPSESQLKIYEARRNFGKWVVDYYGDLKNERANWDVMWQELAEMFLPRKSTVYNTDSSGNRRVNLYDITGMLSNDELASSLHYTLTNPTIQFFSFSVGSIEKDVEPEIARYLQDITEICHGLLSNSNFQTEIHESYLDIGGFGTTSMRIEEDDDSIIRFSARPIFEFVCDENENGFIDIVGREKEFTGRQLFNKFGGKNMFNKSHYWGDQKSQMLDNIVKRSRDKFKVFELFIPTKEVRLAGHKTINRPYVNISVLEDGNALLNQSGFNELIYAISRWSKSSDEVYGRGPGHKAMPAMLMLNELSRLIVQAAQLATKPPVLIPDDGTYGGFNIFPGAINWYRAGTRDEITAFNPSPNVAVADWLVEKLVNQIRQAFMLDKFQIPNNDRMTREEVLQRQQENLRFTSPILGRQEQEFLTPIIERVYAIADRRGLLPEPPEAMSDHHLEVKYVSQVSRVQKSALADNASMFIGELTALTQQLEKPELLDNVNWDKYVQYQSFARSFPAVLLQRESEMNDIREERASQQEEMMAQQEAMAGSQIANQAAGAAKNLDGVDLEGM